jgi:(E)-4-hydroxy-3-methylbut-2-enyl-diphosphate synthase
MVCDLNKRIVKVGELEFGCGRIFVQSMLNAPSNDVNANVEQAKRLVRADCDVIRVAVPSKEDVRLISALKEAVDVPVVADIHFDYRLAIESVYAGADKIRLNPGNIGDEARVKEVVRACQSAAGGSPVPIRVGVNSGSVKAGQTIVSSALSNIRLLEKFDFFDIVVSVKSSSVTDTISAYRELSQLVPYPLHLGVTEAGTERMGLIKSAVGIGSLLCDGIGDTVRVSLTGDPVKEVTAAIDILRSVGRREGVEIISCPTCGRCKIDVEALVNRLEKELSNINCKLKIAVMGCEVNGPGECKGADYGITGGDGVGLIFKNGEKYKKVEEAMLVPALLKILEEVCN